MVLFFWSRPHLCQIIYQWYIVGSVPWPRQSLYHIMMYPGYQGDTCMMIAVRRKWLSQILPVRSCSVCSLLDQERYYHDCAILPWYSIMAHRIHSDPPYPPARAWVWIIDTHHWWCHTDMDHLKILELQQPQVCNTTRRTQRTEDMMIDKSGKSISENILSRELLVEWGSNTDESAVATNTLHCQTCETNIVIRLNISAQLIG